MPKSPKIRFHWTGVDPGLEGVRKWIEKWYGDSTDLLIRKISISCPSPHQEGRETSRESAIQRNETPLHSFLKFAGWEYLNKNNKNKEKPQFEMLMYFPRKELLEGTRFARTSFDPSKAQVIEKGRRDVVLSCGDVIYADIYFNHVCIEVGFTQPFNLCMPLLEGLVKSSIWLPFPKDVDAKTFNPESNDSRVANAYEMKLKRK